MPISPYLANLRKHVGHDPLLSAGADAIIRNKQGEVLLQQRSDNHQWGLPGGTSDIGEKPAHTLVREVFEETGLIVRPTCLVAVWHRDIVYPHGDKLSATSATFECEIISGSLKLDDESLALEFFAIDNLPTKFSDYLEFARAFITSPRTVGAAFEWDETWLEDLKA